MCFSRRADKLQPLNLANNPLKPISTSLPAAANHHLPPPNHVGKYRFFSNRSVILAVHFCCCNMALTSPINPSCRHETHTVVTAVN